MTTFAAVAVVCSVLIVLYIAAEIARDRRVAKARADHAAAVAKLHADQDRAWKAKANKDYFDSKGSTR